MIRKTIIVSLALSVANAFSPLTTVVAKKNLQSTSPFSPERSNQNDLWNRQRVLLLQSVVNDNDSIEEEGLTTEKISVILELTFIQACLQLATG